MFDTLINLFFTDFSKFIFYFSFFPFTIGFVLFSIGPLVVHSNGDANDLIRNFNNYFKYGCIPFLLLAFLCMLLSIFGILTGLY